MSEAIAAVKQDVKAVPMKYKKDRTDEQEELKRLEEERANVVQKQKDAEADKAETESLAPEEKTFKKRYGDLRRHAQQKEQELKEIKRKVELVSSEVIPTMMQEMNISTLKLADGTSVEVKPVYGASIPVDKREEAYKWLRENGLGDLIKNEITVAFGRSEDNKAQQYAVLAQGQGYEPVQKLKVEPMTLKALVRERVEAGLDMPSDLFNLFTSNRTKITRSK